MVDSWQHQPAGATMFCQHAHLSVAAYKWNIFHASMYFNEYALINDKKMLYCEISWPRTQTGH